MMNRHVKCFSLLLALMMALCAVCTAAAEQEKRKMENPADADEWIAVFLGEHPEELEGLWAMSPQMEAAAAQLGGIAGLAKQMAALGTVEEIHPAYEGEIQKYRAFYIPCVFSAMSVDLVLIVQDGMTMPKGEGPFPAVILLQGSGPSDMDETVGSLKPFRDLAEGLAAQGIAVYRFDKRSYVYGNELAAKKEITLQDEYIEDAVNAVRLLAGQDRIDPDRIFVLGHSLGGNAVPAIARELRQAPVKARGYIMMAASPRPLDVLMREQYNFLYSLLPEISAEQQAEKDALFSELDKLQDLDSLSEDDRIAGVYSAYWKWLAAYDILGAAGEITEPVLLLQGEEDYQVTMEDFGIWSSAFGDRENWRLVSFPGLTHAFVPGEKAEGSAVYTRDGKVREDVILEITSFVGNAR